MTQLVLIPGLACNAVMWQSQLKVLPAHFRPHVTDVHTRHETVQDMARGLLDDYPGELILCGASMGGIVAMEAVRQAPHRVQGLALLGTNARPETDEMRKLRQLAIGFFERGRAAEVLRANVPLAFHDGGAHNARLVQTYLDFVLQAGAEQLVRQNRAIMARPNARTHLASVACPMLVMCGESDQLTPLECSLEIAALVPQARFVAVPRCGHMLTMEQPEIVNTHLLQWLKQFAPGN